MTAKIEVNYEKTFEYFENIMAIKRLRLLILNLPKNLGELSELAVAYETALDYLMLQMWLNKNLDILKLSLI